MEKTPSRYGSFVNRLSVPIVEWVAREKESASDVETPKTTLGIRAATQFHDKDRLEFTPPAKMSNEKTSIFDHRFFLPGRHQQLFPAEQISSPSCEGFSVVVSRVFRTFVEA